MNNKALVRTHYLVFVIQAIASIAIGIVLCPDPPKLLNGLARIVSHPSLLSTDYMVVGGAIGVSFVHAGLMMLCTLGIYRIVNAKLQGLQVAALLMVFAYSFYGKNLLNIWPIVAGVFWEAKRAGKPADSVAPLAFFAGSLAPLVSVLAVGTPLLIRAPIAVTTSVGIGAGFLAGYLIGKFAAFVRTLHHGAILYNGAMSSGIVGILSNFILISLRLGHNKLLDNAFISGQNQLLGLIVFTLALYYMVAGIILNGGIRGLDYFIGKSFRGMDFVYQFSMGKTLINMGLVCLMMLLYVLILPDAQLNGPVFGGLFTIVGFAAFGVTIPSMLPAVGGVLAGAFFTGGLGGLLAGENFFDAAIEKVASRDMLVAAMFVGGFSPMTVMYGSFATFVAGVLHSITVPNIAPLHGWMVGYNNGFAMGIIAMFFLPIIEMLGKKDYFYRLYRGFFGKEQTEEYPVLKKPIR